MTSIPSNVILTEETPCVPSFTLRKHIWETFPVDVLTLSNNAYAIVWRRKEIVKTRSTLSPESWKTFEENLESLLLKALKASSAWTVEPAQHESHVCVIRMKNTTLPQDTMEKEAEKELETGPEKTVIPLLTRLNDIKVFFPVVWHPIPKSREKTYSIEFHHSKLNTLISSISDTAGIEEKAKNLLLTALKASTAWNVSDGINNELCRITMVSRRPSRSMRKNERVSHSCW